jgi:hypothetical protein
MAEHYKARVTRIEAGDDDTERVTLAVPRGTWDRLGRPLGDSGSVQVALPAPPTEEAPPPEPMAPWSYGRDQVYSKRAVRYRDALNALDRDGVAWGPGRPMSELPDEGLVLVRMPSGVPYTLYIRKADYIATHRNTYECWWPLPGEAAT